MPNKSELDRRSLLRILSASPLVLGMSDLLSAQDRCGTWPAGLAQDHLAQDKRRRPTWFRQALAKAVSQGAPIVAFVAPDLGKQEKATATLRRQKAEFTDRLLALGSKAPKGGKVETGLPPMPWFTIKFEDRVTRLAVYLQLLLDSEGVAMRELLLESVCVCAPAAMLGAAEGETVVILDAKGRRTGGDIVDLSREVDVTTKLQNLLHGKGRLRRRAQTARTKPVRDALSQLTSSDARVVAKGHVYLVGNIHRCIAAVVEARLGNVALRDALTRVVHAAYQKAAAKGYAGLMPWGTVLERRSVYDPCPPCGMAVTPAGSRKMLRLLTK